MQQAYAALGKRTNTVMRAGVIKGIRNFLADKIPQNEVQRFVDAINFKTSVEFKRAVDEATDWLKKEARGKPTSTAQQNLHIGRRRTANPTSARGGRGGWSLLAVSRHPF
jgi:hypothetical protein